MDRLTDKRFVGEGFYQPQSREKWLEIFTKVPHLKDIYNRLAEYEDTGLTPDEIKNMKIHYDTEEQAREAWNRRVRDETN